MEPPSTMFTISGILLIFLVSYLKGECDSSQYKLKDFTGELSNERTPILINRNENEPLQNKSQENQGGNPEDRLQINVQDILGGKHNNSRHIGMKQKLQNKFLKYHGNTLFKSKLQAELEGHKQLHYNVRSIQGIERKSQPQTDLDEKKRLKIKAQEVQKRGLNNELQTKLKEYFPNISTKIQGNKEKTLEDGFPTILEEELVPKIQENQEKTFENGFQTKWQEEPPTKMQESQERIIEDGCHSILKEFPNKIQENQHRKLEDEFLTVLEEELSTIIEINQAKKLEEGFKTKSGAEIPTKIQENLEIKLEDQFQAKPQGKLQLQTKMQGAQRKTLENILKTNIRGKLGLAFENGLLTELQEQEEFDSQAKTESQEKKKLQIETQKVQEKKLADKLQLPLRRIQKNEKEGQLEIKLDEKLQIEIQKNQVNTQEDGKQAESQENRRIHMKVRETQGLELDEPIQVHLREKQQFQVKSQKVQEKNLDERQTISQEDLPTKIPENHGISLMDKLQTEKLKNLDVPIQELQEIIQFQKEEPDVYVTKLENQLQKNLQGRQEIYLVGGTEIGIDKSETLAPKLWARMNSPNGSPSRQNLNGNCLSRMFSKLVSWATNQYTQSANKPVRLGDPSPSGTFRYSESAKFKRSSSKNS